MKKVLSMVLVFSLGLSLPAFAEEVVSQKGSAPEMAMDQGAGMPMPGKRMMGCPCPMMGKTQMVATDDGGALVLAGNKLMKYDADLNLVKEVEVKIPASPMGCRQCPLMGKMKERGVVPEVAEAQEIAA